MGILSKAMTGVTKRWSLSCGTVRRRITDLSSDQRIYCGNEHQHRRSMALIKPKCDLPR